MIVYAEYLEDQRVRCEAETLASFPEFSVTVLALKSGSLPRTFVAENVRVLELNEKKYSGKSNFRYLLSYMKFIALSFLKCTSLFVSRKVDIVHVHNMPNFLVFAAIVPRLFGKKLVLDIHDTMPETYAAKYEGSSSLLFNGLRLEESICCAIAHKIISVNHAQRDVLYKRGLPPSKTHICLNAPDHKRFKSQHILKNSNPDNGIFKIVYHGTIEKRLGVDLAIQAVSRLGDAIPNLEFHLWGRPWCESQDCLRWIKQSGAEDRIHFLSEGVPFEKLPLELEQMDLGIVGNRKNIATDLMLPVKMLEYVALGIPVVVPRLKAIEHYFSDEMVSYFEPDNVDSMASAILKLYRDKSLRKAQAEKAKSFLAQYGWEKHHIDLVNFYRDI